MGTERTEHNDPRERLLMLYGVWVKCLPHQDGKRRLVERCIASCKSVIAAKRGPVQAWEAAQLELNRRMP